MAKGKPGKKPAKKSPPQFKPSGAVAFTIQCGAKGVIIGAVGPDGKVSGFVDKIGDIKLEKTGNGVAVTTIEFQQDEEFGSCTWRLIGGAWRCI